MSVNSAPERSGDLNGSLKFIWMLEKKYNPCAVLGSSGVCSSLWCRRMIVAPGLCLSGLGSMCLSVPPSARDRSSQGFLRINLDFFSLEIVVLRGLC